MARRSSAGQGSPARFQAVVCDLFGTLIPMAQQGERLRNLEEMGRVLGVDPPTFAQSWLNSADERFRGTLGSLEQVIEHLAGAQGAQPTSEMVHRALQLRLGAVRALLDRAAPLIPALDSFRAAGLRLALISDTTEETVRLWPETALSSRFDVAVFSCVEGICKPDPRIYRHALGRLRLSPSGCAYVGDGGSQELSGAEAVGLSAFMYRYPDEAEAGAVGRLNEDTAWRGTRLTDLRDLLRFAPDPPHDG